MKVWSGSVPSVSLLAPNKWISKMQCLKNNFFSYLQKVKPKILYFGNEQELPKNMPIGENSKYQGPEATVCLRACTSQQGSWCGHRAGIGILFLKRATLGFAKQKVKSRIICRYLYNQRENSCPALYHFYLGWTISDGENTRYTVV